MIQSSPVWMTVEKAKNILGKLVEWMSDEEILDLISHSKRFVSKVVDFALEEGA